MEEIFHNSIAEAFYISQTSTAEKASTLHFETAKTAMIIYSD